jgi:hypothetical protein
VVAVYEAWIQPDTITIDAVSWTIDVVRRLHGGAFYLEWVL